MKGSTYATVWGIIAGSSESLRSGRIQALRKHSGKLLNIGALLLAMIVCPQGTSGGAEVSGRVTVASKPPPEVLVDLTTFPECRKVHPAPLYTRHFVVGPEGGLANVFVYIKQGLEGRSFSVPTNTPVLDQKNCGFQPYVLGVQTHQKFKVRNSEPYMETAHALPKLNREFNIAQPVTGMISEQRFDTPEVLIKVKCEVHPWEFAFIGVVDHSFFAVTDTNGVYRLPANLPSGKYVIEAVHPKAGARIQELTVTDNESKVVDFVIEPKPPKQTANR